MMYKCDQPHLTDHAKDRMKERCGSNKSSMDKMAKTALEKGITHEQTAGSLKRFLDGLYLRKKTANNLRIWGDKVFLFHDEILITIIQLPQRYFDTYNKIRTKEEE